MDKIALMKDEPDKAHGQVRILIFNGNVSILPLFRQIRTHRNARNLHRCSYTL